MNTQQAQDLRRLAEAATRGPWEDLIANDGHAIAWVGNHGVFSTKVSLREYRDVSCDAAYIAAMSPDVALQLLAERAMLLEALKHLLEDTQHAEHEDCEDGPCCVREARAAIAQCEGQL